ncbi:MAG: amidohydrolase [Lentihominibacter sp.]|jgi:aminobenzoyl-glutamate utilization protein B
MKKRKEDALRWQELNMNRFHKMADDIWNVPELGMQEEYSSNQIASLLEAEGFSLECGVAGMPTAFIATWGKGYPVIGFSAEYDALPAVSQQACIEKKPVREGAPGHGCGHNILGVGAAFAASSLKYIMEKEDLSGTIKVFGTPAEELCMGKPFMAKAGVFKGVDVFLDWHPKTMNRSCGEGCNAYFNVKYHFIGKSCHGNAPWHGRSAFDACMLQAQAVELMREHMPPGDPPEAANTINYVFNVDGISYPNVVPDKATSWFIGRFTTSEELLEALEHVDKCAEAAALVTETSVKREFLTASHEKIPNETISRAMLSNLEEMGAPEFTDEEQDFAKAFQKNLGVEETGLDESITPFSYLGGPLQDTSEYTWFAPYGLVRLTMAPQNVGWHNWAAAAFAGTSIAHKTMDKAAQILTGTAIDILENKEILIQAKAEWENTMKGKKYIQLLPDDYEPNLGIANN